MSEKSYPLLEEIPTDDLPDILHDYYAETCKINPTAGEDGDYKTSTLKCIRASLNHHFKETRKIDIISDARFVEVNKMFQVVTVLNKDEGHGEVESLPSIEPEDLKLIGTYFENNMQGPPNPLLLQEIVLFNIIYYMGHRGRQNLRRMKINTFEIASDAEGKRFIEQVIKERDKNHRENDQQCSKSLRNTR